MLRHLLRPLQPTGLLFIAVFAVLFALALRAGLFGLPLALLLGSWLFKYAYFVLDSAAQGREELPVLSCEMVNPLEQRPLMQLALCAGAAALVAWVGGLGGTLLAAALLTALPASIAVMAASGNAFDAINPVALGRVIRALGSTYPVIIGVAAAFAVLFVLMGRAPVSPVIRFAGAVLLLLSLFSLIGGALYERRDALGHEPIQSPERTAERSARDRIARRERMLDDVYSPMRVHDRERALAPLFAWLAAADGDDLETDARAFIARASRWDDPNAHALVARAVIDRLLRARRYAPALEQFEQVSREVAGFRLASGADTLALAQYAAGTGRRRLAVQMLQDFEQRFPDANLAGEVALLRREWGAE
jgi:hypothetical protein